MEKISDNNSQHLKRRNKNIIYICSFSEFFNIFFFGHLFMAFFPFGFEMFLRVSWCNNYKCGMENNIRITKR